MRRVLLFFILSVFFHFLSWNTSQYLSLWIDKPLKFKSHTEPIEVSLQETPDKSTAHQIVRQVEPPKELETTKQKEKTELLSEQDQRVKIQSRAALFGLTKNRFYSAQKAQKNKTQSPRKNKTSNSSKDEDSILTNLNQKLAKDSSSSSGFQNAPSTVGELLPDSIKIGEITALNTDRYLFYSFYSRVEEAIRYKWEHDVEITLNNLNRNQYHNPKSTWSTRLDILLTKEGKFFKAVLLKESGIHGLDTAAINAFREANFFPHPPKEMVGEDGFIRLEYKFHVFYDPSSSMPQRINL
jgi:TonB family protein